MSEYIVKTDGEFGMYRSGLFVLEDEYMAVPAEPLIRCRDCSYCNRREWDSGVQYYTCSYFDSEYAEVELDGFCAWAEPKVGVR